MTPDDDGFKGWEPYYLDGRIYWHPPAPRGNIVPLGDVANVVSDGTGWYMVEAESIEHPAITSYFDHLYAQELGIAYP